MLETDGPAKEAHIKRLSWIYKMKHRWWSIYCVDDPRLRSLVTEARIDNMYSRNTKAEKIIESLMQYIDIARKEDE